MRRSLRRVCTRVKRWPSSVGCRPSLTVSTSGSSGNGGLHQRYCLILEVRCSSLILANRKFGFSRHLRQTCLMHTPTFRRFKFYVFFILAFIGCYQLHGAQTTFPVSVGDSFTDFTGKWESLQWNLDVWVIELKATKTSLTGTVSISPGPSSSDSGPSKPVEIYDGKIDGGKIEFEVKSPDGMRVIRFTAVRSVSELRFTRTVELLQPGASPGTNDIFGMSAPNTFVAKQQRPPSKRSRNIDQY